MSDQPSGPGAEQQPVPTQATIPQEPPPDQGTAAPYPQAPQPSFDDDGDGILNPHEDLGQAGTEPDRGPAIGPAADSAEPAE